MSCFNPAVILIVSSSHSANYSAVTPTFDFENNVLYLPVIKVINGNGSIPDFEITLRYTAGPGLDIKDIVAITNYEKYMLGKMVGDWVFTISNDDGVYPSSYNLREIKKHPSIADRYLLTGTDASGGYVEVAYFEEDDSFDLYHPFGTEGYVDYYRYRFTNVDRMKYRQFNDTFQSINWKL